MSFQQFIKSLVSLLFYFTKDDQIFIYADVTARCFFEETPLHDAAVGGDLSCAKLLIEKMSQINKISEINAQSKTGLTPLHNAAIYGHDEIDWLLIENNANVNAKTKTGNTPLHRAAVSPLIESLPVRFVTKTISQNETTFI
jgi:ankyrin repeat protein